MAKTLSIQDAAYLAGLIDGEGSVFPANVKRISRRTWRLTIANTNRPVLEWCLAVTGVGAVYGKWRGNPKHSPAFAWQCHSWKAKSVLEQTLPYMKIKRERALECIEELKRIERIASPATNAAS